MKFFAKKSLGQHFLHSPTAVAKIIAAGQIEKGETILEIGPGTGILTRALLDAGGRVIAVEKDERSIDLLKEKFAKEIETGTLIVISDDILKTDLHLSPFTFHPKNPFKLIANIPYYITGAILEKFLEHEPRPTRIVVLVQKEVAERIVTRDGKESVLSISVKAFGTPKIIAAVPRGAFNPPPTVDSAILAIEDISDRSFTEQEIDISKFFQIVKAGFAHKRKLLRRNLESVALPAAIAQAWNELELPEKIRAEEAGPETWLRITEQIGALALR